ncbi:MAG: CDP-diacylglycerol--serine O-phosphatidyltransferase [Gemmataceae bacterium]|nr:CDP-diacylglycerol--serine O-phosphatidyltransferase [Gemmataceae bacterium]
MKKIAIVPTLLTLGNGICGFVAITFASKINDAESIANCDLFFAVAGWFIVAAMIFDLFDGYVARLSKTASKFGGELDSLCDAISFGVAPAFLLLKMGPGWQPHPLLHQIVAGIAALYMVCTVLRLARFNVDNTPDPGSHKRFRGLPSPAAAGCLAALAILRGGLADKILLMWPDSDPEQIRQLVLRFVEVFAPVGAVLIALLMVSVAPYPHVTKQILRGRRHVGHIVQLLFGVLIIVLLREFALFVLFWGYALGLPIRNALMKSLKREESPTPDVMPR